MTENIECKNNQRPLLTESLNQAYPDVNPQLWQWWDGYLTRVFQGILDNEINPELVKIIMTSSAVKQIVSPNPRYHDVRDAMQSLRVEEELMISRAARRRQMIFQDTKPDVDFAIVQFDGDVVLQQKLDDILKRAFMQRPEDQTLDVFPIPTNPRISIYDFSTVDPTGMHLQAFNYIIWGPDSSDGIDKRLGSAIPWGSQPSLTMIPSDDGIRILSSSISDAQRALDMPLHYSLPEKPDVFNELEVVLRAIRGKALHNPEMNPFDDHSAYDVSHLFSLGELFLRIPIYPEKYDGYDQAAALMMREIAVTALAHGDNFYHQLVQNQAYGYRFEQFIKGLAQLQGSGITDTCWEDPKLFVRELLGIKVTNSSPAG